MKTIKNIRAHILKRLSIYIGNGIFDLKAVDFYLEFPFEEDFGRVSYLKLIGKNICIHNSSGYGRGLESLSVEDLVRLFRVVVRNFNKIN